MASLMIHLLVGHEYCKNHQVQDVDAFLKGNLAPDFADEKWIAHYSKCKFNKTYTDSLKTKVDLNRYCRENVIDSDFKRGEFLHLLTDYVFFSQYMLNNPKYQACDDNNQLGIVKILYRDYHRSNDWIMKSYDGLRLDLLPEEMKATREDEMEILSKDSLRHMVSFCAGIDLNKAYSDYRENNIDEMEM